MNLTESAKYNLLYSLHKSGFVNSSSKSKTWFATLNIRDYPVDEFPDAGQIADYIFSKIEKTDIDIFSTKICQIWGGHTKKGNIGNIDASF